MTTSADVSEAADTKQPFPEHFHSPGPLCHTFSPPFQTPAPPSSVLCLRRQSSFELSHRTCGWLWAPPGLAPIQRSWYALPSLPPGAPALQQFSPSPVPSASQVVPNSHCTATSPPPLRAEFPRAACTCVSISSLHILSRASQSDSGFSTDRTALCSLPCPPQHLPRAHSHLLHSQPPSLAFLAPLLALSCRGSLKG